MSESGSAMCRLIVNSCISSHFSFISFPPTSHVPNHLPQSPLFIYLFIFLSFYLFFFPFFPSPHTLHTSKHHTTSTHLHPNDPFLFLPLLPPSSPFFHLPNFFSLSHLTCYFILFFLPFFILHFQPSLLLLYHPFKI